MALSRSEHVYAAEETTFGTLKVPIATDAVKVVNPGPALKGTQAVIRGNEKTGSRSQSPPLRCGSIAGTCDLAFYVEPSGTAGTAPDGKAVYKNLMGAEEIVNTTVTSAVSGSNITLASATGIHAGSILGIGAEMRPVASLAGNVATMAVPFSTTPAGASTVKAVNYVLKDPVASSLSVFSYISDLPLVSLGTVFNQGTFSFQDELAHLALGGLGTDVTDQGIPAEPTPVYTGTPIAKGCGKAFLNGVASDLLDFTSTINNGDEARQIPVGKTVTSGISRGLRVISLTFIVYLDSVTKNLFGIAKNRTSQTVFIQVGDVAGKIFSLWFPQIILQTPDVDKTPPEVQMSFTGDAWGYTNEEMVIAFG
jgi:hypothetical protein